MYNIYNRYIYISSTLIYKNATMHQGKTLPMDKNVYHWSGVMW